MILLRTDPTNSDFRAELLHACTNDLAYDSQCEDGRAGYLHRLICATGQDRAYWADLLLSLSRPSAKLFDSDRPLTFEILCLIAADHPDLDRSALSGFLLQADFCQVASACMPAFVRLLGIDGLLLCFQGFASNVGEWPGTFRELLSVLTTRDGAVPAADAIRRARVDSVAFDQFVDVTKGDTRRFPPQPPLGYAEVKQLISRNKNIPFLWSQEANPRDIMRLADDLMLEQDERKIQLYLMLFARRDFPLSPEHLFAWTRSETPLIAFHASRALARLTHPDLRALALTLMADGGNPANGVWLLQGRFQADDGARIVSLLEAHLSHPEVYHDLGMAIRRLCDQTPGPGEAGRAMLMHLYEHDPCSLCRAAAVKALTALGKLPNWIVEECRHDADKEARELVRLPS